VDFVRKKSGGGGGGGESSLREGPQEIKCSFRIRVEIYLVS